MRKNDVRFAGVSFNFYFTLLVFCQFCNEIERYLSQKLFVPWKNF